MQPRLGRAAIAAAVILVSTAIVVGQQPDPFRILPAPEWESVEEMHDFYTRRFESSLGFGVSRMPQPPMLDRSGTLDTGRTRYAVERLELVGLLESATPRVYVPRRHDRLLEAKDFTSRALTPFEARALAALRAGKDVEVAADRGSNALDVLGALRGDGSCLKCHTGSRESDLLGAFSYTLRPRNGAGRRP
jgi:hypothetical protein